MFRLPRPFRGVALILVVLLALAAPARAQTAPSAPAAATPPAVAPVSADELQQLVATLQDPAERAQLVASSRRSSPPSAAAASAHQRRRRRGDAGRPSSTTVSAADRHHHRRDPGRGAGRGRCTAAGALGRAQVGDRRRATSGADRRAARHHLRRRSLADRLTRFCCCAGPARQARGAARQHGRGRGFSSWRLCPSSSRRCRSWPSPLAASFTVPFTHPHFGTRQVARVLIGAILWARIVLAVARVVAAVAERRRALPARRGDAATISISGRAASPAGRSMASALAAARVVARRARRDLRALLRGTVLVLADPRHHLRAAEPPRWSRTGCAAAAMAAAAGALIRNRLADTWHVLAIIYVIGTFGVFVLDVARRLSVPAARDGGHRRRAARGGAHRALRSSSVSRRGFAISARREGALPDARGARQPLPAGALLRDRGASSMCFAALALLAGLGHRRLRLARHRHRPPRRPARSSPSRSCWSRRSSLWELFSSAIERYLNASDTDRHAARAQRPGAHPAAAAAQHRAGGDRHHGRADRAVRRSASTSRRCSPAPASSGWPSASAPRRSSRTSSPGSSFWSRTRSRSARSSMSARARAWSRRSPSAPSACATCRARCRPSRSAR